MIVRRSSKAAKVNERWRWHRSSLQLKCEFSCSHFSIWWGFVHICYFNVLLQLQKIQTHTFKWNSIKKGKIRGKSEGKYKCIYSRPLPNHISVFVDSFRTAYLKYSKDNAFAKEQIQNRHLCYLSWFASPQGAEKGKSIDVSFYCSIKMGYIVKINVY